MSTNSLPDLGTLQMQNNQRAEMQKEMSMRRLEEQLKNAPNKEAKLKQACKGFESIFLNKLWQQMRDSIPKGGMLHSKEGDMYVSMFDQKLSEELANAGGIGLGDMLFNNLKANMMDASRVTSPSNAKERLPLKPLNHRFDPKDIDPPTEPPLKKAAQEKENSGEALYEPLDGYEDVPGDKKGEEQVVDFDKPLPEETPLAAKVEDGPDLEASFGVEEEALRKGSWRNQARLGASVSGTGNKLEVEADVMAAVDGLARNLQPVSDAVPAASPRTKITGREQAVPKPPASSLPQNEGASAIFPSSLTLGKGKLASDAGKRFDFGPTAARTGQKNTGGPEPRRVELVSPAEAQMLSRTHESVSSSGVSSMHWPVSGRVTSGFGWRKSPFTGERTFHSGVDIAAKQGDPVTACWDGKVIFSGFKNDYGRMVILEHPGGWQSYYGHTNENNVAVGDTVRAGQEIASIGNTGRSTGPHLHFELRRDGLAWDPEKIQQRLAAGKTAAGNA